MKETQRMGSDTTTIPYILPPFISPLDLLHGVPVGIVVVSRERRLLFLNQWLADQLGHSIPSLLGSSLDSLLMPDEQAEAEQALDSLFDSGQSVRWQATMSLDGANRIVGFAAHPIYRDETAVAAQVTCQDVSAYHEMLAKVSTLYLLANQVSSSLDLPVVLNSVMEILKRVLDCRGVCIFLLDEGKEWLEMRASSGIKPHWQREARMRLGEGISGQVAKMARPLYIRETRRDPDFIVFDPAVRSLLVVPLIVKGEVIGTLNVDDDKPDAFSEDMSRLLSIVAAQAAAAIQTARLHTDLKERAEKLAQAHEKLQGSDRVRSEFAQNVSHELRTPLTFIKAYVELLLDGTLGSLTERQRQKLRIVADRTEKIVKLVGDILSLQQVERAELHFAPLSMVEVARASMQSAQATVREAGLSLVEDFQPGLPPVWGDRARLDQVFSNLIENALKFSPEPGGTITVRLRNDDGFVRSDVQDQGIGIPEDQLTKIFERFYQVDGSMKRRFRGTGLGLAIVKEIVDAHGGTVIVESQPDVGSTFSFTVPLAADQPE